METQRIAILTETLPAASVNLQPWRYLGNLAQAIQDAGHETSAVTTEVGVGSWNGVRVESHPDPSDFRSASGLRRILEKGGFDAGIVRLTASLFFSRRRGLRAVPSNRRLIGIFLRPLHSGWDLARRFLDPSLLLEMRNDAHHAALYASRRFGTWSGAPPVVHDYVFLWSSDRESGIRAGLSAASCHVVPHPFDPFFLDRRPSGLGTRLSGILKPVPRRVVFSGPPELTRGVNDMVRLPRGLPAEHPTQVLLLLRDPAFREPTATRRRIGVHELLIIRGLVSREEIRAAYQRAHVAVFPYRFVRTGLPLVALEAVAAGLPVVTTRVHPIREWEGRTGLVFARPRDPADLGRAIRGVLDEGRQDEIRQRNEAWIQSTPDWPTIAKTFVSFVRR